MNNKKIYIAIAAVICVVFLAVGAVFLIVGKKNVQEGAVSRYEWMEMLGEQFGITEYNSSSPYFKDVEPDNPHFACIQSAAEQEIIDTAAKFNGEDFATGRFIALTAIKSIGESKFRLCIDTEDVITDDTYIDFAVEQGLIEKERMKKGFSKEECEQVLENLKGLYFSEFWKDDYVNVSYQDDIIELSPENVLKSNSDGSEILVTSDALNSFETGNIIVFEQENTNLKLARKITNIGSDGTLTLDVVELDEVLESLTVSDITELTFDDIVNYYGLDEDISAENNLMFQQNSARLIDAAVFPHRANAANKGFTLSVTTQGEGEKRCIAIKITDTTGVSFALPISEKVKMEDEYSAEINIDKIYIGGQVDYLLPDGVKYAEAAVDVHATIKSEIKAEKEKKILLLKKPVPLGNGVVGADIQIYLVLSVDGSISFEAELPIEASISYEKNRGLRNFKHSISFEEPMIEVNCNAGVGLRFEPVLMVLGCLNMMDMECDIGVSAGAKDIVRSNSQICEDVSISFPVLTITACDDDDIDTLIGDLGFSGEWEIITSDNAPIKRGLHFEIVPGERAEFVKECTYDENKEISRPNVEKENSVSEETTEFAKYEDYSLPIKLIVKEPLVDEGDYYTIKGELRIDYTINAAEFNRIGNEGTFTIRDKNFVKGAAFQTEEYPATLYPVYCVEDDCTYYVMGKFTLDFGSWFKAPYYTLCHSIPIDDATYSSMTPVREELEGEFRIAKDASITSLFEISDIAVAAFDVSGLSEEEIRKYEKKGWKSALQSHSYTAEECFTNHILIDDYYNIAEYSTPYGEMDGIMIFYITFDENGMIDSMIMNSYG